MGYLEEGLRSVEALSKVTEIYSDPGKIARLIKVFGDDERIDNPKFREIFKQLKLVTDKAFV